VEGLLDSFQTRLMARSRTRVEWSLHDEIDKLRVVSYKAALDTGKLSDVQKVVVCIHSLQVRFHHVSGVAMLTGDRAWRSTGCRARWWRAPTSQSRSPSTLSW
jgi:hypothetical protein